MYFAVRGGYCTSLLPSASLHIRRDHIEVPRFGRDTCSGYFRRRGAFCSKSLTRERFSTVCKGGSENSDVNATKGSVYRKATSILSRSSDALPYAVVAAAGLALVNPSSFGWFRPVHYAPALGFLMFAVGVNLKPSQFAECFQRPEDIAVGAAGQWIIKPVLGLATASLLVPALGLPASIGTGIILVACVSGAQLSNYATFLVHPEQAPLSIVLTALSTAGGVLLTPALALLLLGARLPVDAFAMAKSIVQIVLLPVAAGLALSTWVPKVVEEGRPYLASLALLDTCACVGASLASNSDAARSRLGALVLLPVVVFHAAAFVAGYAMAAATVAKDSVGRARCISLETGMQSSLLGLLLATRFFKDPLVCLPCGISVIVMTLAGFGLVVWWRRSSH